MRLRNTDELTSARLGCSRVLAVVALVSVMGCVAGDEAQFSPTTSDVGKMAAERLPTLGQTCQPADDPSIANPTTEADRVFNAVVDDHLERLDDLIGRYARGEVPVYAGTAATRDNGSVIGYWGEDGDFSGKVVASLMWKPTLLLRGGMLLTIVGIDDRKVVLVGQLDETPSETIVTTVMGLDRLNGPYGACTSCMDELAAAPSSLRINDLVATQSYPGEGVLRVEASAQLAGVAPHAVTFEDIAVLNIYDAQVMSELVPAGHERVRRVEDVLYETVPVPDDLGLDPDYLWTCGRSTAYQAEWYVDATCLQRYGLRDLVVLNQETCCSPVCTACPWTETCY